MPSDEDGSMIARIFGGSGELDNLVTMDKIVNRSDYRIMENQWKNAVQESKEVKVMIDVVYDGANKRPKEFNVHYIIDGEKNNKIISNGG